VAIEFNCPHCGKLLTTSDERASARAMCPACSELITVPAPASNLVGGVPSAELAPTGVWPVSPAFASTFVTPATSGAAPAGVASPLGQSPGSFRGEFLPSGPGPAKVCPNCRSQADAGAVYCSTCGMLLGESGPSFQYAPFWRRVVAALIDLAITSLAAEALRFVLPGRFWSADDLWLVLFFLYQFALESSSEQATIGKRLMKIIVCGSDGRRLSLPRAAIRTLAKGLSFLICGVGFIMPLLTLRRQALHDVLTDAVVVCK